MKKLLSFLLGTLLLASPVFADNGDLRGLKPDGENWQPLNLDSSGNLKVVATGSSGAPTDATYITQTANSTLSAEQALASLSTGIMRVATTTGVVTSLTTSAGISGNISDETGSDALVFANTPTLVTPILGTPTSGTLTNATGLPISTGVSGLGANIATALATPSSANLAAAITDEIGTGSAVFNTALQNGTTVYAADAVGTDAYAITLSPVPTGYVTGQCFNVKVGTANTGGATLNVNALGAKTILKMNDTALATGDIEAGQVVTLCYDGTNFQMQSQVASSAGGASAPLTLTGSSDAIQLKVLTYSTNTNPIFSLQEDGGVPAFSVEINPAMSGAGNLIAGLNAGDSLTTGTENVLLGNGAGTALTSRHQNVFIGTSAGSNLSSGGDNNNCIGYQSCGANGSAGDSNQNSSLGSLALTFLTDGDNNSVVGYFAGRGVTTGSLNSLFGYNAGYAVTTGQSNTLIGDYADVSTGGLNYAIAIGSHAIVKASQTAVFGAPGYGISHFWFGEGQDDSSPLTTILSATDGVGTDIVGADLTVAGGASTGNGADGKVLIKTSTAGASGTTLQTLATRATIDRTGITSAEDIVSTSTGDIGWSVVDQTDNQACTTGCTSGCVFGIANATGAAVTNIVSCADTTADLCVCAGAS